VTWKYPGFPNVVSYRSHIQDLTCTCPAARCRPRSPIRRSSLRHQFDAMARPIFVDRSGLIVVREHGLRSASATLVESLDSTPAQNRMDSPSAYLGFSNRRTGWIPELALGACPGFQRTGIGESSMRTTASPAITHIEIRVKAHVNCFHSQLDSC
jgi:hypothetical protein